MLAYYWKFPDSCFRLDVSEARCSQTWHDLLHYAFKVENQIGPFLHVSLKPLGRFSSAPESLDYGSFTPESTEHFTGHPDFRCYIRLSSLLELEVRPQSSPVAIIVLLPPHREIHRCVLQVRL